MAADMPVRAVSPLYSPVPAQSWTGFYAGVIAGANILENGRVYFDGGLEGGYNYQYGKVVLGFETDVTFRPLDQQK